jgi:NAD-dependent SIR2 family protein deacetylase
MSRVIHGGEWVEAPALSTTFNVLIAITGGLRKFRCEVCQRVTMGRRWVSITREVVRCSKCYTPPRW